MTSDNLRLLAISGSLRSASTNTALLQALAEQAPSGMTIALTDMIGRLPIFDPDMEGAQTPDTVTAFAHEVATADGLVIACPEYAHGIPGGLKNALDWLVSRDEIPAKPVMLVRASTRSDHAHDALCEVLRTMSVRLMPDVGVSLHLLGKDLYAQRAQLSTPDAIEQIKAGLANFSDFIRQS